jgi:hypothetical protein
VHGDASQEIAIIATALNASTITHPSLKWFA